jgi:glycosyltransferase involved in cell wall biosynthesis
VSKKILFLSSQIPFPPDSGGKIKSNLLLKHLCQDFEVGLISGRKDGEELGELNDWELTFAESYFNEKPRTAMNMLRAWMKGVTLNTFRNASSELQEAVNRRLDWADIVLVDHLEMMQFVPKNRNYKVVLHQHNAEHKLWERKAEITSFPMSWALKIESGRVKKYELESCNRADQVWAAPLDREELAGIGVEKGRMRNTYHLGSDDLLGRRALDMEKESKHILFFGTLSWDPNLEGLVWFLREIWPELKRRYADLELDICGKGASSVFVSLLQRINGINYHGFVDDLEPFFQDASLSIAPLNYGSGMKIKVIESLYRGLPVVTTEIGAESLDALRPALAVAENEIEFRREIEYLLEDSSLRQERSSKGRELASQHLSWKSHWEELKGYLSEF